VRAGDGLVEAVAWSYASPPGELARIAGLIAFYNERVDLEVDGDTLERPRTQWHREGWS
jgi:uncharacterized protein (DUF427 family)